MKLLNFLEEIKNLNKYSDIEKLISEYLLILNKNFDFKIEVGDKVNVFYLEKNKYLQIESVISQVDYLIIKNTLILINQRIENIKFLNNLKLSKESLAHDLKSKIFLIKGYLHYKNYEKSKYLLDELNNYINQVLCFEAESKELVDLNLLFSYLLQQYSLKGNTLSEKIKVNKEGLLIILDNLISNTKKHSKADRVSLGYKKELNLHKFLYTDNGNGKIKESGIGLKICQKIVAKLNGTFFYENKNKGYIIWFSIPI